MDTAKMLSDLWTVSPVVGVLGIIVYVLWKKSEKTSTTLLETMATHSNDRKESSEKMTQIVAQNSATNLQLSTSVDNLGKAMTDKFQSLETKIDRSQRASRAPKSASSIG